MPVLVWSDRDGTLGNSIRTGRRVALSAEEFRPEAEELDRALDDLLDMAWHALTIITQRKNGKPSLNSFEQAWVLGRAVSASEILRHPAMQGEERGLLWQALTPKAWYGIRNDATRDSRWQDLIPSRSKSWQTMPKKKRPYEFLEVGYWLREQQLHDAGEVFGWKSSNAQDVYQRASLRSIELRREVLEWLRHQTPEVRAELAKAKSKGSKGFSIIPIALRERFPDKGPGSALLPQHYPQAELRAIVCETLDAARDLHFPQLSAAAP
ncbi:MAG: hypothetical protein OXG92_12165 [Chloroflexi bacterium]|nr:hypothetical protein [Chloroflexota bacterium]MDE2651815.1 hypothetical protein [Chloroflexota bacterium]